jgi:tRNA A-37 threonylcarbamoyl transferase component Bud32
MKYFLLTALFCFFVPISYAQQSRPIIVDGRYSAGSASVSQPAESTQAKEELGQTLNNISTAFSEKDYTYVINAANSLLNKGIDDPRIYTSLALAYEGLEDYAQAGYYASQAIAKRPSNVEAFTIRAYAYFKQGDILRAHEDIETALKLNPKSTRAQNVRKEIFGEVSNKKITKPKPKSSGKELPPWFFMYVVCVILVIFGFMFYRYRELIKGTVDEKGRRLKEINIKEQYHFIRSIGEGGMGKVYEAYDNVLKRKVAVKRIKPELLKSNYVREQFLSEARMVAMLHHPCIVEIYTVIETTNSLYLVFEYVEGQTLETRLDIDNYLTFEDAKDIFGSVCKGLSYAHSNDIVHCDLKPGNIMISDSGVAKVMDFGVAKKLTEGGGTRTVAGTPAYMSPEQQKGFMTKQSDIYSLGVCLYEALVGQVPWSVQGFDLTTKRIVPPSEIAPSIPKVVDKLIETSINDDPVKRIQSVDEFWEILRNA